MFFVYISLTFCYYQIQRRNFVKKLIDEKSLRCKSFTLKYLLFEECDDMHNGKSFFSLSVELRNGRICEIAEARDFTASRTATLYMLKSMRSGKVTPTGLPYIIEDYIAEN